MTDRDFLLWIYERLVKVHCENELTDYMHKLKSIAYSLPDKPKTRKVKLLAWLCLLDGYLVLRHEGYAVNSRDFKRIPSEDKEIEIEE